MMILAVGWATLVTGTALAMCALGLGQPNVADGESVLGFWFTLWGLSFISVPMGIFGAALIAPVVAKIVSAARLT